MPQFNRPDRAMRPDMPSPRMGQLNALHGQMQGTPPVAAPSMPSFQAPAAPHFDTTGQFSPFNPQFGQNVQNRVLAPLQASGGPMNPNFMQNFKPQVPAAPDMPKMPTMQNLNQ